MWTRHWVGPSSVFIIWSTGFLEKIFPVDVALSSLWARGSRLAGSWPPPVRPIGSGSERMDGFLRGQQRELRNKFSSGHVFVPVATEADKQVLFLYQMIIWSKLNQDPKILKFGK